MNGPSGQQACIKAVVRRQRAGAWNARPAEWQPRRVAPIVYVDKIQDTIYPCIPWWQIFTSEAAFEH